MKAVQALCDQREYVLQRAILVYGSTRDDNRGWSSDRSRPEAFATVHPVVHQEKGRPEIGVGAPLSLEQLSEITNELQGGATQRAIAPAHLLYSAPDRMLWYRPARRHPVFFHTGKKEFDQSINGKEALWPALLFLAAPHRLQVWALASDHRPDASTPVFHTPSLNVYDNASLCSGTFHLPLELTPDVSVWEKAYYETAFTHSVRKLLTHHPKGHNGLWQALVKPNTRPSWDKWLAAFEVDGRAWTAGDVLNHERRGRNA